jgi:hypothetical protein
MQRVETLRFGADIRLPRPVTAGRFQHPLPCQKREGIKIQAASEHGGPRKLQIQRNFVRQPSNAISNNYSLSAFNVARV